jgi:hypothetical protein
MRESPKVLDTKLNKEIYLMALVKNQRYSKNSKNIFEKIKWKIRRFKSKFVMIEYDKDLRDYVAIGQ